MARVPEDPVREHRITYEIVVDCYDDYEVAAGWRAYLEDRLAFPFEAKWKGSDYDSVRVVGMENEDESDGDILVEVEYSDGKEIDTVAAPLADLEPLGTLSDESAERVEAIADWKYWLARGYRLIDPNEEDEYY